MFKEQLIESNNLLEIYRDTKRYNKEKEKIKVSNEINQDVKNSLELLNYMKENLTFLEKEVKLDKKLSKVRGIIWEIKKAKESYGESHNISMNKLKYAISDIENEYKMAWVNYFEQTYSNNIELLRRFAKVTNDIEINIIITEFIDIKKKWPINNELISRLDKVKVNAESKIKSIDADENITNFISKLSKGEAKLTDVNGDIINWLRKKHILDKINLKL